MERSKEKRLPWISTWEEAYIKNPRRPAVWLGRNGRQIYLSPLQKDDIQPAPPSLRSCPDQDSSHHGSSCGLHDKCCTDRQFLQGVPPRLPHASHTCYVVLIYFPSPVPRVRYCREDILIVGSPSTELIWLPASESKVREVKWIWAIYFITVALLLSSTSSLIYSKPAFPLSIN